jgi:ABC-type phosphate transport system permease subunit
MSKLTALALSIAVLGGIWAYIALGPLGAEDGTVEALVWVGFIAWGAFFHSGADDAALKKTIVGMIYGSVIAGVALSLVGANPLGLAGAVGPAVYIAATVFLLVIVAGQDLLSSVPSNVYGYAATAGYALQTANAGSVTATDLSNPVLLVSLSVVLGTLFGLASSKLAGALGN